MKTFLFSSFFSGSPTYNLPHASNADNHFSIGSGAAILRAGPLPSLRLGGEFNGQRVGMKFSSTNYFGPDTETFNIVGLRYQVVDNKKLRLAPFVMIAQHLGISDLDHRLTGRLGLALKKNVGTWQFDSSLSLIGGMYFPYENVQTPVQLLSFFEATLLGSEYGFSKKIGRNHWFRLGLLGVLPNIRYRYKTAKGINITTTIATLGSQNILQIDVSTGKSKKKLK